MRANNAGDFLRMLNPDDCIYGFKKLSNWDLDKVIKLYKDRGVLRGGVGPGRGEENPVGQHL